MVDNKALQSVNIILRSLNRLLRKISKRKNSIETEIFLTTNHNRDHIHK